MLDDMRMRKLEPKTQSAYVRAVRKLAAFLGRSPDMAAAAARPAPRRGPGAIQVADTVPATAAHVTGGAR